MGVIIEAEDGADSRGALEIHCAILEFLILIWNGLDSTFLRKHSSYFFWSIRTQCDL